MRNHPDRDLPVEFRKNGDASLRMILVAEWVRLQLPDLLRTIDPVNPSRLLVYPVQLIDAVAFLEGSAADADGSAGADIRRNATTCLDPTACCLA
jgi:hypothetical protein